MEAALQKVDLKNIDRSKWKSYRFDTIAKNVSERVDPNNTELETYVGLEHIDSESLHIKRTGTRDDVNGTKLRCYPGDIIFGRRRAYQRKAGIATFNGFCSAHSLVLRANPAIIHPKLFPFFIHSDVFMNRAVDISVGSLSPTINWGTLKTQEFQLPPKEQHEQLAELLWAMDELIENESVLLEKVRVKKMSFIKFQIFEKVIKDNLPQKSLGKLFDIKTGSKNAEDAIEGGVYPFFTRASETKYINGYSFDQEALLLPGEGHYQIKYYKGKFDVHQRTYILSLKKEENLDLRLYKDIIQGKVGELLQKSVGSTVNSLRKPIIESIEIPDLSVSMQEDLYEVLRSLDDSISKVESKLSSSKKLLKSIIDQIF